MFQIGKIKLHVIAAIAPQSPHHPRLPPIMCRVRHLWRPDNAKPLREAFEWWHFDHHEPLKILVQYKSSHLINKYLAILNITCCQHKKRTKSTESKKPNFFRTKIFAFKYHIYLYLQIKPHIAMKLMTPSISTLPTSPSSLMPHCSLIHISHVHFLNL